MDYRFNSISLTRFTSTICALAGIENPKADEPVESILKL